MDMKRVLIGILVVLMALTPIYSASGLVITLGEGTNANSAYKNTVMDYFKSNTDKDLDNSTVSVITAAEVNSISQNISGATYSSNQILSCALVDLSYSQGIKIVVDKSKINLVTPKMYENALRSTGITNGYVVVTSPVSATGESALAGVLKSYETAVGTEIPEEAKQAATQEIYTQSNIANETNHTPDEIANLFEKVQTEVQNQNITNINDIKVIVINVANQMNMNLTDQQAEQIASSLSNAQQAQGSLDQFKNSLQNATQQASESEGFLNQIWNYLDSLWTQLQGLVGQ